MNNSKVAVAVSKTISLVQMVAAIFLIFIFGLCAIVYLTDKEFATDTGISFLIVCLVFVGLGVWLVVSSRKKSKLLKEFKKYVSVISHDPSGYIPDIAASLGTSEDVVKSNLELMIKKRYFSSAFIDKNSNCIVIANKQVVQEAQASTNTTTKIPGAPAVEMVTVKCSGCGGINTIAKGQTGECDYCGSAIKGE